MFKIKRIFSISVNRDEVNGMYLIDVTLSFGKLIAGDCRFSVGGQYSQEDIARMTKQAEGEQKEIKGPNGESVNFINGFGRELKQNV